ncbi:MAG TPA: type II secretion system protein N [Allosphingosinicella sp.]|jgi:general secretion pathway protein C
MRLALDPRARRLLRRLPRTNVYSVLELILLSLLAMQCARLVWTMVTPLGPVGEWKAAAALRPAQPVATSLLGSFDPFFRASSAAAPAVVTSLNLTLFGVRENRATGRGSAIIGTADGQQRSYAVGEEIMPGVTLTAVGFDNVTVSRSGTAEQLFLDQSPPATAVGPGAIPAMSTPMTTSTPPPPLPVVVAPPPAPPANANSSLSNEVQFQPRLNGGQVTGVTVQPQGSGVAFRAAGLQSGDVVVAVNGQPISSAEQARSIAGQLRGGDAEVQVERNGRPVSLRVRAGQ